MAALVRSLIVVAFCPMLRRTMAGSSLAESNIEWIDAFSVADYRPMERLFSEADFEFIKTQPGYHPSMPRRLRSERRKLFHGYLRKLTGDFNGIHAAATLMVLSSQQDRPDLALLMMKQKLKFAFATLMIQKRLLFHTVGLGTVDARKLVASVEAMRAEIRQFAPGSLPLHQ